MDTYFLQADLIVPYRLSGNYEDCMRTFLANGAFRHVDPEDTSPLELVAALKSAGDPFSYSAFGRFQPPPRVPDDQLFLTSADFYRNRDLDLTQTVYRYVHLWRIPDLEQFDLPRRMIRCSEDPLYMRIHEHVTREVQEFVRRVDWSGGLPPDSGGAHYLRVIRQFRLEDIGTYLLKLGMLFPALRNGGWHQRGQFQNVTGLLNTITELWQTTEPTTLRRMMDVAPQQASAFKELFAIPFAEVRESFLCAPYFERSGSA